MSETATADRTEGKMDKRPAYFHFRKRCRERFGIFLNDRDIEQIGKLCHDGSFFKICDQRAGVGLYRVQMGKSMAAVAYDRNNETVLTIMPIIWTSHAYRIERERAMAEATAQTGESVQEMVDDAFNQLGEELEKLTKLQEDENAQMRDQEKQLRELEAQLAGS